MKVLPIYFDITKLAIPSIFPEKSYKGEWENRNLKIFKPSPIRREMILFLKYIHNISFVIHKFGKIKESFIFKRKQTETNFFL